MTELQFCWGKMRATQHGVFLVLGLVIYVWLMGNCSSIKSGLVVSAALLPFLATVAVSNIRELKRPALLINSEGVTDNSSTSKIGLIAWREIARVVPLKVYERKCLGVYPEHSENFLNRLPPLKRVFATCAIRTMRCILIPIPGKRIEDNDLLAQIDALRKQAKAQQ